MPQRPAPEFEASLKQELEGRVILLLEDDPFWAEQTTGYLKPYAVARIDHFATGDAARDAAMTRPYDVLLLDREVPGMKGLDVLHAVRTGDGPCKNAPVLMITSLGAQDQRNEGLIKGADDYITKGTDELEVVARVAAQLRRTGRSVRAAPQDEAVITNGPMVIDDRAKAVTFFGTPVSLTPKQLAILTVLARVRGLPVTNSMLWRRCWPNMHAYLEGWENTVFQHVFRLRGALKAIDSLAPEALRPILINIPGEGYVLRDLTGVTEPAK